MRGYKCCEWEVLRPGGRLKWRQKTELDEDNGLCSTGSDIISTGKSKSTDEMMTLVFSKGWELLMPSQCSWDGFVCHASPEQPWMMEFCRHKYVLQIKRFKLTLFETCDRQVASIITTLQRQHRLWRRVAGGSFLLQFSWCSSVQLHVLPSQTELIRCLVPAGNNSHVNS